MQTRSIVDSLAIEAALRTHRRAHAVQNSFYSGTVTDVLYKKLTNYTAQASFTSEATLLGGPTTQPNFPAGFFDKNNTPGQSIGIIARGVLSSTGTPTYTFQSRLSPTQGTSTLSGASIGVSSALTTGSGVTNKFWEMRLDLTAITPGDGSGNCTLEGAGLIFSPGLASPFMYPVEITTPDTATWTTTIDGSVTNWLNLSVTCSASSASNTIQLKQLFVVAWN